MIANSPPAFREALERRKTAPSFEGGDQKPLLTDEQREAAAVFANELMERWVVRKRRQWRADRAAAAAAR